MSKSDDKTTQDPNAIPKDAELQTINLDGTMEMPTPSADAKAPSGDDVPDVKKPKRRTTTARPKVAVANKQAKASAEMVVGGLDMMRKAIGGLPVDKQDPHRKACLQAWEVYCLESGLQPPAWAVVAFVSTTYVAPAFATDEGATKTGTLIANIKGWWAIRKEKRAQRKVGA